MTEPAEAGAASDPRVRGSSQGSFRRVLLVGFMASGKTAVGRRLAEVLDWEFLDFDDVIEARAGRSIPELFREEGEEHFRRLEAGVGSELLERTEVVLASGGGWPAAPGRMEELEADTLSVWLRVSPREAVRRARSEGPVRPLLEGADPVARARQLLGVRREYYARAKLALDAEAGDPKDLARRIAGEVRGESVDAARR